MRQVIYSTIVLLLFLVSACAQKDNKTKDKRPPLDYTTTKTNKANTLEVSYKSLTLSDGSKLTSPPTNQHFHFVLTLKVLTGSLPKAMPTVDADMPEHGHGMNVKPTIEMMSEGTYQVKGMLFHMAGVWEMYVQLPAQKGESEKITFTIYAE